MTSEQHDSYFRSLTFTQAIPKLAEVGVEGRRDVVRKASTKQSGLLGSRWTSHGERERHNADGHNFGVKIFQLCLVFSSLLHANLEQPFRNLTNKVRGKYFYKEVFLPLYHYPCVCYSCMRLYYCAVMIRHMRIQHMWCIHIVGSKTTTVWKNLRFIL